MQVCALNNGLNVATKRRKTWDNASLANALLLLQTSDLKTTAKSLDLGYHSLRHALSRKGISVQAYRREVAQKARKRTKTKKAFIKPTGFSENRPFLAMDAFENKKPNGCSWPYGDLDGNSFYFCGEPRLPMKPYCAECAKRAYKPKPANFLNGSSLRKKWAAFDRQQKHYELYSEE